MAWEVTFLEDQGIVRVAVWGSAAREEHHAARAEAGRLLRERDSQLLLVDLHDLETEGVISMIGCFDFGSSYLQPGRIPAEARVAHVLPKDPKAAKDVEFLTAVAANQGATIRNFESREDACAWLLTPPKEEP